ncbi:hypothetical protein [Acetobacter conturbans]|uniref:Uncharacterized protein n=1 Tax=Acetobacter conturbans TaxID=1737472 RepID=A0ABX0JVF0_9PROT|nr:hypothetical protein [Acetobacter conturbans]NHN87362.1 hypothetical protein [Acetobacter conturbans]
MPDEADKPFAVPTVDPAEERAFLERRLTDLLERNAAQARHIQGLEERITELETQHVHSRFWRLRSLMGQWLNRFR